MIQNSSDYYGGQAQDDESVLHVLHHSGEDDQVGAECVEDGPFDVSLLKTGEKKYRHQEGASNYFYSRINLPLAKAGEDVINIKLSNLF